MLFFIQICDRGKSIRRPLFSKHSNCRADGRSSEADWVVRRRSYEWLSRSSRRKKRRTYGGRPPRTALEALNRPCALRRNTFSLFIKLFLDGPRNRLGWRNSQNHLSARLRKILLFVRSSPSTFWKKFFELLKSKIPQEAACGRLANSAPVAPFLLIGRANFTRDLQFLESQIHCGSKNMSGL